MSNSLALQYIKSKNWEYKETDSKRVELSSCPLCKKSGYGHFYCIVDSSNQDGLWICHHGSCGKTGNLTTLKEHFGDKSLGRTDMDTQAGKSKKIDPLPNVDECHQLLMEDADALDYLMNGRGLSREIIEKQKIGLKLKQYFREAGEIRALVYPYLVNGNCIFAHFRSLPTMPLSENKIPKCFASPSGHEVPLYNGEILKEGLKELILVEGEMNCVSAMDKGIENIVGVPGANVRKALWIDTLDSIAPEKLYICYDKDKVGQKAAQELASRVGIEKCWKIKLPDFEVTTDEGETRPGKDLNEYFTNGGTLEAFEQLKKDARLFDVMGVSSVSDSLDQLEESFEGKDGLSCKYLTPWNSLNKIVGFDDGDVIDVIAAEKTGKSTFALNLIEHMVDSYKEDGVYICLEMPTVRMARKWVAHVTNTQDTITKNPEESSRLLQTMKGAVKQARAKASARDSNLYFCYPQIKEIDDMYKLIRDCIRRYGVKWIVVDNLQLLCDRTLKNPAHRTTHLSQISKVLTGITKDHNVKMIRILQPHRVREGQIVTTDSVDGSSQIAKDCDCMMTLHRARTGGMSENDFKTMGKIEETTAFDSKMLCTVGLARYSSGGAVTLNYCGPSSTVTEYDVARQAVTPTRAPELKPQGWSGELLSEGIQL